MRLRSHIGQCQADPEDGPTVPSFCGSLSGALRFLVLRFINLSTSLWRTQLRMSEIVSGHLQFWSQLKMTLNRLGGATLRRESELPSFTQRLKTSTERP